MTEYVAAGYMTRFQCLGGACEDTCCKAWEVPISEGDYKRLASALGVAGTDKMVKRIPNGKGGALTVINKKPDHACPELDATGLCKIHAAHGEPALPDICMSYPRVIGRLDARLELTGKLSCPEVARLALLADEVALVPVPPDVDVKAKFGREIVRLSLATEAAGVPPYFAAFATVRAALVDLCDPIADEPFVARVYAMADLALRLAPFYHREAKTLEADKIAAAIADVRSPDVRAALEARRAAAPSMEGLALQSVIGMLFAHPDGTPAFEALLAKTIAAFTTATPTLDNLMAAGPEHIWRTHMARRPAPTTPHAARLDRYLARAARNYWLQDWFPVSETLVEHVMHLALRTALLRFLLVAHPDLTAAADDATCDRAAVETIYATVRAYDHNPQVRAGLSDTLNKRRMLTADHCAAMLKL